tara:strand:+ start:345 stop:809 length:465 start_codon:yes stop_codon:yes gene_type:complete
MDRSRRSLEILFVEDEIVDDFLTTLDLFKEKDLKVENTYTVNGFQSVNILALESTKELSSRLLKYIDKKLQLFHIHLIDYDEDGQQDSHDHKETEDYSFILYLNDSDGNTVFEDVCEVSPKKGKLVLFKSDVRHYGKPTNTNKKVAVGALKSID